MSVCQYDAAQVFPAGAELVRTGKVRRFGFVCTNSLRQEFNRRVLERLGERAVEVTDLLETLSDLGHVTRLDSGRYGGH